MQNSRVVQKRSEIKVMRLHKAQKVRTTMRNIPNQSLGVQTCNETDIRTSFHAVSHRSLSCSAPCMPRVPTLYYIDNSLCFAIQKKMNIITAPSDGDRATLRFRLNRDLKLAGSLKITIIPVLNQFRECFGLNRLYLSFQTRYQNQNSVQTEYNKE